MPELFVPERLEDAVGFMAGHASAVPVAGGTDVLIDARLGRIHPDWLVDLTPLGSLAGLRRDGETLHLGALTTIRSIELDAGLLRRATALAEAARVLGSVQIRTMATVGGNICHATPSAEMPPALLVHEAVAEIAGPGGGRSLPLAGLFAGPGRTTLAPGELLAGVRLRVPESGAGSCYLRQTVRDGAVASARVALGAVAPVPLLVAGCAGAVEGSELTDDTAREAGARAAAACSPITDARGTAAYRRTVVAALVPRALRISWLRATGAWPEGTPAPINGALSEGAP